MSTTNFTLSLSLSLSNFRDAFVDPTPEEIFNMVTKENPQTFYVGKMVMATVTGFAHKKPQGNFF